MAFNSQSFLWILVNSSTLWISFEANNTTASQLVSILLLGLTVILSDAIGWSGRFIFQLLNL